VAQVLLSAFLSAPQGESVPGLPGMRTTQAAQQSRLAEGAQALAVPVRVKQPFVIHQLEFPKKPPLYDFLSILKTRGSCNAEQKVAPLIPPRAVYCIPVFLEGGCGGVPRGRGEGGNLLRAHRFKLRHPRTTHFFLNDDFTARGRPLAASAKRVLTATMARLRKQADHKAECYCEADARSDWAGCALIAPCAAYTKAPVRAF
jgi:hypothetical protein